MVRKNIWMSLIIVAALLSFISCEQKRTLPLLREPVGSIAVVSGVCTQVDVGDFPEARAFVSIVDQSEQPLFDFSVGNFSIAEDGAPVVVKEVKRVDNNADSLSVVLVLDRSGSMYGSEDELDAAAISFVNQLGPRDEAEIINFDHEITMAQGFTSSHSLLEAGIKSYTDIEGGTALYDAVARAVSDLSSRKGRKFILAMTDGEDTASTEYSFGEAKNFANSKGLAVFTVGLGSYLDQRLLQELAADTGGRFFLATTAGELITVYQNALKQFNNEIEIHFRSLTKGARHLKIYMNYGKFRKSFEKVYSN